MRIGTLKEIKTHEYRVGLLPGSVRELTAHGHTVLVESGAGAGIGYGDAAYTAAGARVVARADEVFAEAELIVKVKEPQSPERKKLRRGQTLFTYLHLAPDPAQAEDLLASGATGIAYETVTDELGRLPLLAPMSQVAGRMSIQAGARCLEKESGGRGVLLGGVPGVRPAKVAVIGGGTVGSNAVEMALGVGADVAVLDRSLPTLESLAARFGSALRTVYSNRDTLDEYVAAADLVIGAVLVPGAAAPKLIPRALLKRMRPGSALVDVAIDQGGIAESSRPTTHADPIYVEDGIVHYCVANMPGAVPHTSTYALNNATLPFVLALADKGVARALKDDAHLRAGLNVHAGKITHAAVAAALKKPLADPLKALDG
ncbi:MAG: alanine dehydrogenase [Alphaproteobacteria bacterium]|nr:alanine dehydrogenase [Alphaproteobacteria bacterium]